MTSRITRLMEKGIAHLGGGGTIEEFMALAEVQRLPDAERAELYSLLDTVAQLQRLRQTLPVPTAPRSIVAANRARVLGTAVKLREEKRARPTWGWLRAPVQVWRGVLAATLTLVLLLSAGGAANAAAGSLPGSPLYPLKLVMEDTRLTLTFNQAERAKLYLRFVNERIKEIVYLAPSGHPSQEAVVARMHQQLQGAVQAAQSSGLYARELLGQVIETSSAQVEVLRQTGAIAAPETQPLLNAAVADAEQALHQAQEVLQQQVSEITPTPLRPGAERTAAPTVVRSRTPMPMYTELPQIKPAVTNEPAANPTPIPTRMTTPMPSPTPAMSATPVATLTTTPAPPPSGTTEPFATPSDTPMPTLSPAPVAIFSIICSDYPDPVPAGDNVYYDIYVVNEGEVPLTNVVVTVKWSPADCAYLPLGESTQDTWEIGTLRPHTRRWVRIALGTRYTCAGHILTNEAIVTCDQGNTSSVQTTEIGTVPAAGTPVAPQP